MDTLALIPTPDVIPAPAWFFLLLDIVLFALHILMINVALGSILIVLFRPNRAPQWNDTYVHSTSQKIPTLFALGINMGVAPLLFMQVIYGHLLYSSSVLMAAYWILIIPLLIIAYYAVYLNAKKRLLHPGLSKAALCTAALILFYIALVFVNNMTLMVQPDKWIIYFDNRRGLSLNLADPTFLPRYFHFIVASIAVSGLFVAFVQNKRHASGSLWGLRIFGYSTIVQAMVGMWFLASIPHEYLRNFMGDELMASVILFAGFLAAMASIAAAFSGNLRATTFFFLCTLATMVLTRHNLRTMYLKGRFSLDQLQVTPQYGVMALFVLVLIAGICAVLYMLKLSGHTKQRRASS